MESAVPVIASSEFSSGLPPFCPLEAMSLLPRKNVLLLTARASIQSPAACTLVTVANELAQ